MVYTLYIFYNLYIQEAVLYFINEKDERKKKELFFCGFLK